MTYRLIYPHSYVKRAKKFLRKHPQLETQYVKTLQLLELNPFHPSLRLHSLKGQLAGLSSVYINISYRIVLQFEMSGADIILIDVGDHNQVY